MSLEQITSEKEKKEPTVALEVAEADFNRFLNAWDIDGNIENMNSDDRDSFKEQKNRILSAISRGFATVDEEGDVHYILRYPDPKNDDNAFHFRVPKGDSNLAMDKHKPDQTQHKSFEVLGKMVKKHPNVFSKMDGRDLKFCQGVACLFLAS